MNIKYPGEKITSNGNQLTAQTEARISDCGVFYPITPSTEQGEHFELSVVQGNLTVFGESVKAIETEGEHSAQGGAIAISTTGKRVSNFTSGQGIVYGLEQYYHAPGKLSTMVLNVGARALTKHALNVHCGHDDIMAALDTGWTMLMAKDAQQACDQTIILRKVTEQSLTPGMNIQDGFLTTHLERTFRRPESGLLRDFLGHPADMIDTPTEGQKALFGLKRRRVPKMYDLKNPILLGSVQNQEHYMTGVIARRTHFHDEILGLLDKAYNEFAQLTGRKYGFITEYNCEKADTLFLSLGSSAENIEAACDYIKEQHGEEVGVLHLNVIRPFPEEALRKAIQGKKNLIILERTDEPNSTCNPLARDVRSVISKSLENSIKSSHKSLGSLTPEEAPRIFEGVYGLGSRDFRPEGILGAYEFVTGKIKRRDGKDNTEASFFYIGVNHPYQVESEDKPSLLPDQSIAVRIHSIGGWGAITTGKNMAEILGELSQVSKFATDDPSEDVIHISANPKYGSEKKGAPTNYFLVESRNRIKVNCDLKHVDVVLCPDPKIFTHTNPLNGLKKGGAFIWESEMNEEQIWQHIPVKYRKEIQDKKIQIYSLKGFHIAKTHTPRRELQTRMQGNAFLGAFFKVSHFLDEHEISQDKFLETVYKQYEKKFGKLGPAVVDANMEVMKSGFEAVTAIPYGKEGSADHSKMLGEVIHPQTQESSTNTSCGTCEVAPIFQFENYQKEFLNGSMDEQEASPLTTTGIIPAASGKHFSKFVSRIQTPEYNPYNCTQCMACISVCPDTALPNTAQDIPTVLSSLFKNYITDKTDQTWLLENTKELSENVREDIQVEIKEKKEGYKSFTDVLLNALSGAQISTSSLDTLKNITPRLPLGYGHAKPIFQMLEKKNPGDGGLFSIFVSDLCKGCGECVIACGSHEALVMVDETEEHRANHLTSMEFFKTLPQTPNKYLGKFDPDDIENSRAAVLHNHLLIQDLYGSFVSGDGACAGCGEKSILRGVVTVTEAYMKPLFKLKSKRLLDLSEQISSQGEELLSQLKVSHEETYNAIKASILHLIMGFGGDTHKDTLSRIKNEFKGDDKELLQALSVVLKTDSENHKEFKVIEGQHEGMSVMGMTANTGCNTVYGSTHPSNPHPYPWMNSLFQDGSTIGWLVAESFIQDHIRRSVLPERLARHILEKDTSFTDDTYHHYTHLDDAYLTDQEIQELPKVWAVGGDGGMGDIGYQNVSKAVLQNRPNVAMILLDTQVYSNTGGQNSDSSIMTGGFDMNQFGQFHEGKLTERKEVALTLTEGHGSPYVANVSMANTAKFFKSVLDGLTYRGTAFIQSFTTCQPEHGVGDDMSAVQALRIRDSRGMIEFVFDPRLGETATENLSLKGNPQIDRDWAIKKDKNKTPYNYTIPQWAFTEGRFRKHFYKIKPEEETLSLEEILKKTTQLDIINRKYLDPTHRAYIPQKGVYEDIVTPDGEIQRMGISRHLALFTIERRKNWRKIQARSGIINKDYEEQRAYLKEL